MRTGHGGWEDRVGALYWQGLEAQRGGGSARGAREESLRLHGEAVDIVRGELRSRPDEPRLFEMLASLLYTMAASHTALERPVDAVRLLEESETSYARSGVPAAKQRLLIADVRMRRARAHGLAGHGMSALFCADRAIAAYALAGMPAAGPPRSLELARVLSVASVVHLRHGDPDQALACAGQALSRYREGIAVVNADKDAHLGYAVDMAADVAARIEAARGHWDNALAVDAFVLEAVRVGWGSRARALARQAVHLRAAGRPGAAAALGRATELDPEAVRTEERTLSAGVPISLAEALVRAEGALGDPRARRLRQALTGQETYSATGRGEPGRRADLAGTLADLAERLTAHSPQAAWRTAVESHLLHLGAFADRTDSEYKWLMDRGHDWARALLTAALLARDHHDDPMRDDVRKAVDDLRARLRALGTLVPKDPRGAAMLAPALRGLALMDRAMEALSRSGTATGTAGPTEPDRDTAQADAPAEAPAPAPSPAASIPVPSPTAPAPPTAPASPAPPEKPLPAPSAEPGNPPRRRFFFRRRATKP
ncbi:hypothetical protein [Streptomyces sp. NPDC057496]|uniref:hypothetical protein n=1 Tax=Streptomyces sp. NPDC057496 TaxID=3346149 RepID=UPI0036B48F4C